MPPEPLASDLAMSLDPVLLMRAVGLEPDPWQKDFVRSVSPRVLLNCCRQSGKSTSTASLALHTAIFESESLILLLSQAERQSKELLLKVLQQYRALGRPVPADAENKLTLELSNGSRILALPGKDGDTIRGYSGVRLLVVDEASRVSDMLYRSIRPMLAVSGGRLLGLSTPFGKRGWWYEAWASTQKWHRFQVTAEQCPRITPEFLEEERATMGALFYSSEYDCKFVDNISQVFATDLVDAAFSHDVDPWFPAMGGSNVWVSSSDWT